MNRVSRKRIKSLEEIRVDAVPHEDVAPEAQVVQQESIPVIYIIGGFLFIGITLLICFSGSVNGWMSPSNSKTSRKSNRKVSTKECSYDGEDSASWLTPAYGIPCTAVAGVLGYLGWRQWTPQVEDGSGLVPESSTGWNAPLIGGGLLTLGLAGASWMFYEVYHHGLTRIKILFGMEIEVRKRITIPGLTEKIFENFRECKIKEIAAKYNVDPSMVEIIIVAVSESVHRRLARTGLTIEIIISRVNPKRNPVLAKVAVTPDVPSEMTEILRERIEKLNEDWVTKYLDGTRIVWQEAARMSDGKVTAWKTMKESRLVEDRFIEFLATGQHSGFDCPYNRKQTRRSKMFHDATFTGEFKWSSLDVPMRRVTINKNSLIMMIQTRSEDDQTKKWEWFQTKNVTGRSYKWEMCLWSNTLRDDTTSYTLQQDGSAVYWEVNHCKNSFGCRIFGRLVDTVFVERAYQEFLKTGKVAQRAKDSFFVYFTPEGVFYVNVDHGFKNFGYQPLRRVIIRKDIFEKVRAVRGEQEFTHELECQEPPPFSNHALH